MAWGLGFRGKVLWAEALGFRGLGFIRIGLGVWVFGLGFRV